MPNEFKDVDTNPDPESTVNALGAMSQLASVFPYFVRRRNCLFFY